MDRACMFKFKYHCSDKKHCQENKDHHRIESIINASKIYKDDLHVQLEKELKENPNLKKHYHKDCVSTYTSESNTSLKRFKEDNTESEQVPTKRLRASTPAFNPLKQCMYCGISCLLKEEWEQINPNNPNRWEPAYLCRTVVTFRDGKPYKERILEKCNDRDDEWGTEVKTRILAVVSDLHAADMRYHVDCMQRFFANRTKPKTKVATSQVSETTDDAGLEYIIKALAQDTSKPWTSADLFKMYKDNGGTLLTRKYLIQRVSQYFQGDLVVFSSPGYASILTFRKSKESYLKLTKDDENDNLESCISVVAKKISDEISEIVIDKTKYNVDINKCDLQACVSDTLLKVLSKVSPKLGDLCLPSMTIGNIVTGVVKGAATELQRGLGVLLRDSKMMIDYLKDYGITCSYDEVLLFKKSAAMAAFENPRIDKSHDSMSGMMQIVVDNYDAEISSPNGRLSTHSLGGIIIQPHSKKQDLDNENSIKRLKFTEKTLSIPDEPLLEFNAQKKPEMLITKSNISEDERKITQGSLLRAKALDFQFIVDVNTKVDCPEYSGFNTQICREQGHILNKKSNLTYTPLIDNSPSDPKTLKTAMIKGQRDSKNAGQNFTIFTADMQLYKITVHILWQCPNEFTHFYARLGGMHQLMSYVGCIGNLMVNSGLAEILSCAFGGVLKMLLGKKFPQNVRALRMLVEELLRPVILRHSPQSMDELLEILEQASSKTRTAKLWVDCLIKPIFNIMIYVRAERENDWLLHLESTREMIPLFFAAGHCNYARYGLYYLRTMESLPEDIRKHFLKGEHTVHLNEGLFNGLWSDMAIECTLMRYGHSHGGLTGVTLMPQTVKTWTYSVHACNRVVSSIDNMREKESVPNHKHKEELPSRIRSDAVDRLNIRKKLDACIDPIQSSEYPESLVNIVTGQVIVDQAVNVDKALQLGQQQMVSFEETWPDGFHKPISKKVKTMAFIKKHVKIGEKTIFDTETIYAKAMALQNLTESVDTKTLLSFELAPYPTSYCDEHGLREAKAKSALMNALKVEMSQRNTKADAIFLDGCAYLWTISWPKKGKVQDFLNSCRSSLRQYIEEGEVYLVFDRYYKDSVKAATRTARDKGASRAYNIYPAAELPPQDVVLTVTANKAQLIDLIIKDLTLHKDQFQTRLTVTGKDPTPVSLHLGVAVPRNDLKVLHEEADSSIIHQLVETHYSTVKVVADDTDIFVLLCHFIHNGVIKSRVVMTSPKESRTMIDINESVIQNTDLMPNLLAAHGLTGCDTVGPYYGIGKKKVIKVLKTGKYSLSAIGNPMNALQDIRTQAKKFILACYGIHSKCDTMSDARHTLWKSKLSSTKLAPPLKMLPPTDELFMPNVLRAHFQVANWKHAHQSMPTTLNPLDYGWVCDTSLGQLVPQIVPEDIRMAPDQLLQTISCSCAAETACKTKRCKCTKEGLACSPFCACEASSLCHNERTVQVIHGTDTVEDDSDLQLANEEYES